MKKIILAGLAFCAFALAETIVIDGKAIPVFVDNTKLLQSEMENALMEIIGRVLVLGRFMILAKVASNKI